MTRSRARIKGGRNSHGPFAPRFTSFSTQLDAVTGTAIPTFTVTTAGNPTATLSKTGTLPTGLTFTNVGDGTATITGTPTATGRVVIRITATNTEGSAFIDVTVTTTAPASNSAPAFTLAPSSVVGIQGQGLLVGFTATGTPVPALTMIGTVPGLTLVDTGGGNALLVGTPTVANAPGGINVTIRATNSVTHTDVVVNVRVNAAPVLYNVPATYGGAPLDPTGILDSSLGWQKWLNSLAPNFTVNIDPTAIFTCDGGMTVKNRAGLTIHANGAGFVQSTFVGIDTPTGLPFACGGLGSLNRGMFTWQDCPRLVLDGFNMLGAMNLGNYNGDYAISSGVDITSPSVQDGRKIGPNTATTISMVRGGGPGGYDVIRRSSGSWLSGPYALSESNNRDKGIHVAGFANSNNNGYFTVANIAGCVTATDIVLSTKSVRTAAAAGATVTVWAGRVSSTHFAMVKQTRSSTDPAHNPYVERNDGGNFITDGFVIGQRFRIPGFLAQPADFYKPGTIHCVCKVTATRVYFYPDNGDPVNEAAGASVSFVGSEERGAYLFNLETQHAFRFSGCLGVQLRNSTAQFFNGDFASFLASGVTKNWCEDVLIEGCTILDQGRQGVAPGAVRRFVMRSNILDRIRRTMVDFEPNGVGWGWEDCWVINNTFGSNGLSGINLLTYGETTRGMVISGNTGVTNINVGKGQPSDLTGLDPAKYDVWIIGNEVEEAVDAIKVVGARRIVVRDNDCSNGQARADGRTVISIAYTQDINTGGNLTGSSSVGILATSSVGTPPSSTPPPAPF